MTTAAMSGVSLKGLWDMSRCRFEKRWQYEIAPGVNILNEATFLSKAAGLAGGEVIGPSTGAATDIFAGVALHSGISGYIWASLVRATVPLLAPYTIDVGHTDLIIDAGTALTATRVNLVVAGTPLTVVALPGPPGAGDVMPNPTTGIYTFDPAASAAGLDVDITYRWNLSAVEHAYLMRDSHINKGCEGVYDIMTVGCGHCIVYTMMYDARPAWVVHSAAGGNKPVLAPNGEVSINTLVPTGVRCGEVIKAPSADDPYLGIEYVTF